MNYLPGMVLDMRTSRNKCMYEHCIIELVKILAAPEKNDGEQYLWKVKVLTNFSQDIVYPNYSGDRSRTTYSCGSNNFSGATILSSKEIKLEDVL